MDTMADRIVKKAKTLFDTREKDKHRYAAFESILGRIGGLPSLSVFDLTLHCRNVDNNRGSSRLLQGECPKPDCLCS